MSTQPSLASLLFSSDSISISSKNRIAKDVFLCHSLQIQKRPPCPGRPFHVRLWSSTFYDFFNDTAVRLVFPVLVIVDADKHKLTCIAFERLCILPVFDLLQG